MKSQSWRAWSEQPESKSEDAASNASSSWQAASSWDGDSLSWEHVSAASLRSTGDASGGGKCEAGGGKGKTGGGKCQGRGRKGNAGLSYSRSTDDAPATKEQRNNIPGGSAW